MDNVYIAFLKKSFQSKYVYRINSYLHTFGAVVKAIIQFSLWSALLNNGIGVNGVTFENMTSYIIINMIILSLTRSNSGNILAQKIRDGSIAIDFIRPIKLKYYLFSEDLGENLFRTVFSILPVCLICVLFYSIQLPGNIIYLLLFVISIVNGIVIIYHINYIFGLLAFWLKTSWYIWWYTEASFRLFGGTVVPLWFYPKALHNVSMMLPFRFVTFEPISIYLGKLSLNGALEVVLLQIIWIILLILIEKVIWVKAQDKVIVQGG